MEAAHRRICKAVQQIVSMIDRSAWKISMSKSFLVLAVLKGILCAIIASAVLNFMAMWLLPELTDPMYADKTRSNLLGLAIWLVSIVLGIVEGRWNWKRYKRKGQVALPNSRK